MPTTYFRRWISGGQRLLGIRENTIEFFADEQHYDVFLPPVPSGRSMPRYFKNLKPQVNADPSSSTVKRCVPFLDALTHGYIIPMWADVWVRAVNDELEFKFPENLPMQSSLSPHDEMQIKGHPLSNEPFGNIPAKWHSPWGVKTPKGWSCLFTSPLNHLETRFKILDGIVDTDTYYNQVNFPFIWTGGEGEFLIEAGTPLVQVIPFRRETTKHVIVPQDTKKRDATVGKLGTKLRNSYRSFFWHKKQG